MTMLPLRAARAILTAAGLLALGTVLAQGPGKAAPRKAVENLTIDAETQIINKWLGKAWQTQSITPSPRCTDDEFLRRVTLDIIGRIATEAERDRFQADVKRLGSSPARTVLVDRLLSGDDYVRNWSTLWTHWLMTRTGEPLYREQIKLWLYEQIEKDDFSIKELATQLVTAAGKSNENGAVNYILAHLGAPNLPQEAKEKGQFDMVPVTFRTFRLFLGYQIQCAQCHDHPHNADWKQPHFWSTNIWLRQTVRIGNPTMMRNQRNQPVQQLALADDPTINPKGLLGYETRGAMVKPVRLAFYDGTRLPKGQNGVINRRQELAKFITNHANFPKAFVNRMWGHFFGRGLGRLRAFDDFGEHNEIVHPELLDELGQALIRAKYNPRLLMRWICNSDAYQLSRVANKTNTEADTEPLMSRFPLKAMSPEQLLESLLVATRPAQGGAPAAGEQFRADFMRRLVERFGNDDGEEGVFTGTVTATLMMMNGPDINRLIAQSQALQRAKNFNKGKESLDFLFLAAYNRPATKREYEQLVRRLTVPGRAKDADPAGPLQDIFWALLNSGQFFFNH